MKSLRVTSGIAKNRKLKAPNIPDFRAVQEVAKLAIFSIIGDKIEDSQCLDLFAGSGNLGIEALSRGAAWCDFVDENRKATQIIEENLRNCGLSDRAEIFNLHAVKFVAEAPKTYNIVFADPFYSDLSHKYLLENLVNVLSDDGTMFFLHGKDLNLEKLTENLNLEIESQRRYGVSFLTVITKI